jgi:DNA (cytosine-5)-methyltransferase 1
MNYKARGLKTPLSEASHDGFPHGTVLSLFSGAGGLDIGLEAAGLHTIGYLENNEDCLDTIEMNRPSWKRLHPSDVVAAARKTRTRDLGLGRGELDVIAAGPPCQPFSSAAQWRSSGRLGMEDDRAGTIHATIDLIREFQPKVLIIENVIGFVRADRGAITVIRDGLIKINEEFKTKYGLHFAIVDSADYGVPQHRRRAILIASRDGRRLSLPEPTHRERPVRAWDAIRQCARRRKLSMAYFPWRGRRTIRLPDSILVVPAQARSRSAILDTFCQCRTFDWTFPLE